MLRNHLIFLLILSFFLLKVTQATAGNYTWTGGTSTSWSDKHNWAPASGPPSTSDNVTIPLTSPNLPIVDASAVTIATLTFTGSTTLTLNFPLTVTGTVTVNGAGITPIINGPAAFSGASLTITTASTTTFIWRVFATEGHL